MTELILASTSKYRVELLERLAIPFRAVAHLCDERALEPRGEGPEAIATFLAKAKAESLVASFPRATILGSDQVVALDDTILEKPGTFERACAQLASLSGREHRIMTAIYLRLPDGTSHAHLDSHRMHVRPLSRAAIERYVAADEPYDCAGSYRLESRGISLFSAIEGSDHTGIVGLPLIATVTLLAKAGIDVLAA
jgi:septum formation protein